MTTPKKPGSMLRIDAYLEKIAANLAYPAELIARDMFQALHDALESVENEETAQALLDDFIAEHPNLTKSKVLVPAAMKAAAFGAAPTLAAQAAIIKRYGQAAAEECAAAYGGKLGSIKPGRDADAHERAMTVETARKVVSEANAAAKKAESANPFSAHFKGDKLAAIADLTLRMGTKHVQKLAADCNCDIAGRALRAR